MFSFSTGPPKLGSPVWVRIWPQWRWQPLLGKQKLGLGGEWEAGSYVFPPYLGLCPPKPWTLPGNSRKPWTLSLPATEPFPGDQTVSALTVLYLKHVQPYLRPLQTSPSP